MLVAAAAQSIANNPVYQAIRDQIITPLIVLAFAAALLLFIWGAIRYIIALREGSEGENRKKGQQHMLWGAIGIAIMISVYGIMQFIIGTLQSLPGGETGWNGQTPYTPTEVNGL
jgi:hypothetical protein